MSQIKVEIKVDDALTYTFMEEDGLIEGFDMRRSMDDDISALSANVIAGEVNLTFSNLFNEFNILVNSSPFAQLKNGQELKVYSVSENGTYTLFTGNIVDFVAPTSTDTQSCNVRAVDRLHALLNSDMTMNDSLQVEKTQTFFEYITRLFAAYGVVGEDLEIDEDLRQIILDFSLLAGKSLAEQLNEICKATDSYIYVNRVGRVIVKCKSVTGVSVKTYTREDPNNYLTTTEYGYSLFSSYNSLKVGYVAAKVSEVKSLLVIGEQAVQSGDNVFNNFDLGVTNLYELDSLKIISASDTILSSLSATASSISFTLTNPTTEDDIVDIEVFGRTVDTADAYVVKSVETEQTEHSLEVKSLLVQSKAYAEGLAEKLYIRASEPIPYIKAEVEIKDFPVDLGYIVTISDSEAEIDYIGYIHSIDVEYDGQGYSYFTLGVKRLYQEVVDNE
jgi:hypothetical protein